MFRYPPSEPFMPGYEYERSVYGDEFYDGYFDEGAYYDDGPYYDDGASQYYDDGPYMDDYYGDEVVYAHPPPFVEQPPVVYVQEPGGEMVPEYIDDPNNLYGPVINAPPISHQVIIQQAPQAQVVEPAVPAVFDARKAERAAARKMPPKKQVFEPAPVDMKKWFGDKWAEPQPFLMQKRPQPVLCSPDQLYKKETKESKGPAAPRKKWSEHVRDQTHVARITDWLYVCGASAVTPANLKTYGVTQIINVTTNIEPVNLPGIKTTWVKVEDSPKANIAKFFEIIASQIADAKKCQGHVLMHCNAGMSRSPTLAIAYMMKCHRMGLADAVAYIKDRRPSTNPNAGFIQQLKNYEAQLFGGGRPN